MSLSSGDEIRNRYRILSRIGDSSYRATDLSLRQACMIHEFSGTTSERVTQLASLQHPRLPRVIDLVQEGEQSLLVTDLMDGITLSEHLYTASEPTSTVRAETWLKQLAQTLDYLHQHEPSIAHGNVALDSIVIRPDGTAALNRFSSYARQPQEDIQALGMILGYLTTHNMPTLTADEMKAALAQQTDYLSQKAFQMLSGQMDSLDLILNPAPEPDAPSTVPLTGRISDAPAEPASGEPVMPWDKPKGPETIIWGEHAANTPPQPASASSGPIPPTTAPFGDVPSTPTGPTAPKADPDTEVMPPSEPIVPVQPSEPVSAAQTAGASQPVSQAAESRFDGDANIEPEEDDSRRFNWMWILVGIAGGVILLCVACIAFTVFVARNPEMFDTEPTPAQFVNDDEGDKFTAGTEVPIAGGLGGDDEKDATRTPIPIPPTLESEPEPETDQDDGSQVNLPADDFAGDVIRNDEFGYEFVLPEGWTLVSESEGQAVIERVFGEEDKGISLIVFPKTQIDAGILMDNLIESITADGGTIYGDPAPATFDELSGSTVTANIPPESAADLVLLGQLYALENDTMVVAIVAASLPDQFDELSAILPDFIDRLEIFEP